MNQWASTKNRNTVLLFRIVVILEKIYSVLNAILNTKKIRDLAKKISKVGKQAFLDHNKFTEILYANQLTIYNQ